MEKTKSEKTIELLSKIYELENVKGQTPSSMITLVIPPKYCI
jgi:hypothetical protein